MGKRKTVGELSNQCATDTTKYDYLEAGHALIEDIGKQIDLCIQAHMHIIDEPEFCVVMVLASDNMIAGVMRRKFYAWPYLPKPRPRQTVFLYTKATNSLKRLWSLPNAKTMAIISEMPIVAKQWQQTKAWCDAFFDKTFFDHIRKESQIDLLAEFEYLNRHREELVKAGGNDLGAGVPDAFDFSKVTVDKVVNPKKFLLE